MKIFVLATFENSYVSVKGSKAVVHQKQFNPLTKVKAVEIAKSNGELELFLVSNDGYYVCAELNNTLAAKPSKLSFWQKFKVEKLSENYVSFLSAHGKYLSAEANGVVTAGANEVGQREKFKLLTLNGDLLKLTEKSNFSSQALLNKTYNNYFQQAMSLEKQGKLEDAIKHYKRSLQENPNFSWGNYRLAKLLAKQGDSTQALEHHQKAIYWQYNHSYFHYDLGLLLESMHNYNAAMSSYLNAIELDSENICFIEKCHHLYYKKGFCEELMKQNNESKTEVGNFNLSKVSFKIRDSSSKDIKSKQGSLYHPAKEIVVASFNPDNLGTIIYHVETIGNESPAFFGRVSPMHQLFTNILQKHPYFQGTLRLCFGDRVPEHILVSEQNRVFCFSPRKNQKFAVPIPDAIFFLTQGYSEIRKKVEQNWISWENRKPCAFWRGSSAAGSVITINNWQDNPRVKLCNLALELNDPEFFDAKITLIAKTDGESVRKIISQSGICGQRLPEIEFIKRKYVIDIDGNSNSWPGLFTKLLRGSCVLKVDSEHYQWYYHKLEPYVNYVPIKRDLSDLVEKINWCREHDNEAKEIAERGRKLALSMTVASELNYAEKVILEAFNKSSDHPKNHFEINAKTIKMYKKISSSSVLNTISTILIMKPKPSPVPLIRIGGQQDGAYLIPNDLDDIKACFSPGVANRKAFEDELTDAYGIQCHMCDKSSDVGKFPTPLREGMQTFRKKWLDVNGETDSISLDAWVEELAPDEKNDLMLQMDIEGAEYRNILQTSDKVLKRFRIIIVEVHNLGVVRNSQEFETNLGPLLRRLNEHFICVHAHPNNCCGDFIIPGTNINLPNVYELTFLRSDRFNEKNLSSWHQPMMPHPLDIKRNVDGKPPIFLSEESPTQVPRTQTSTIKLLEDKLDYYVSSIPNKESEKKDSVLNVYKLAQSIANHTLLEENINIDSKDISDVAEGKHYYLSSSYVNYPKNGLLKGKRPFFFHTEFGLNQYITVDLEKEHILTSLLIVNRVDGCRERSRCLFYTTHDTLDPDLSFGFPLNINEAFWRGDCLECNTNLQGVKTQYITIFSPENTALHFSAIRVFGIGFVK